MNVALFGNSGFIGKHLQKSLQLHSEIQNVSLRTEGWEYSINEKTEVYINLIGKAHDHRGLVTIEEFRIANVELAKQIFDVFKRSDAKLMIHISSLAALEEIESNMDLTETENCRPQSVYGITKREAEKWLLAQKLPCGKKLIILRPPMVHGEGDKGNLGLLYKFISKGLPYPFSSINNKRSFISIDNFTFFIEKIIFNQDKLSSEIYHICDDEPVSTNEIINIIGEFTNKKISKLKIPKFIIIYFVKIGDFAGLKFYTQKIKKMTGNLVLSNFKIKMALGISSLPLTVEEGLSKTIKSFQK